MSVRIVPGEISARDVTNRVAVPTSGLPKLPPFERVAETIATPRRKLPLHRHDHAEVLTYVIEGSGFYELAPNSPEPVVEGSLRLLTAHASASHAINPGKGQTIRYFAVVTTLLANGASATKLQSMQAVESAVQPDGTSFARLVGPTTPVRSAVGLEAEAIRFQSDGTSFRQIGHSTLGLAYALAGRGTLDGEPIEIGEAAVIRDAAGIALQGRAGFRVVLLRVPRPTAADP
ncbi:MAG TPA: cupin domain-containing protein [Acidimicrobiales bacterium]|nr:cupin domain-containing protein [Acidimicrobiales bacterium]